MKVFSFLLALVHLSAFAFCQATEEKWGVVLSHPEMQDVIEKRGLAYRDTLKLDVYTPRQSSPPKLPAVIFLPEMLKNRSWELYRSWCRLVAAHGLIGVAVDVDPSNYVESLKSAFRFLATKADLGIDTTRLGIFAASHIPDGVIKAFVSENTFPSVGAVTLYYREPTLSGPFRRDLPVMFVTDDQSYFAQDRYNPVWSEVQKSKAPWTLVFGAGMPHFFDAFADSDEAKRIVRSTIYFWKNELEPVPASTASDERAMIASLYSGDRSAAAARFKAFLEKNPADQYALLRYGMLSFLEGNFAEAELAYTSVVNLEPVYMIDLVKILLAQGKSTEADKVLSRAMATGKVRRSPYAGIGDFLYSLGNYREGLVFYERALTLEKRGDFYYQLAIGHCHLNQDEDALNALQNSISRGYTTRRHLEQEEAFARLRSNARFKKLLAQLKE